MRVSNFLAELKGKHAVSHEAIKKIYRFFTRDHPQDIAKCAAERGFRSYNTMRKNQLGTIPKPIIQVTVKNDEGEEDVKDNLEKLPRELTYEQDKIIRLCGYLDLKDIYNFFQKLHHWQAPFDKPLSQVSIEISSDGVQESKNGKNKLHIISVSFEGCRQPLPWSVWEFKDKTVKPSLEQVLLPIINQIKTNGVKLKRVAADGLEQNVIRGLVSTNGFWSCAHCLTKGSTKVYGTVHFPLRENNPIERTSDDIRELIDNQTHLFIKDKFYAQKRDLRVGIKNRSPLLDVEGFDLVQDVAIDSMHLLHGGITKAIWERVTTTKAAFPKAARRSIVTQALTKLYTMTKVPTEIRHKPRDINPAIMKCSEWQTLDHFCFVPMSISLIGPEDLKMVLLTYSFLTRVLYLDEPQFLIVNQLVNIEKISKTFQKAYARLFTTGALTFNPHLFSHALQYRRTHGPMWQYSTARYESLYAKTRTCYTANAPNVPKQLLQTFYGYQVDGHHCRKQETLRFDVAATQKTDDSIVYYRQGFYRVNQLGTNSVTMIPMKTKQLNTSSLCKLPWTQVGVRIYVEDTSEPSVTIDKKDIKAKGIICGNIISAMYPQWLIT